MKLQITMKFYMFHMKLQAVAAPGLTNWRGGGGGGYEGQTRIFWGAE